MPRGTPTSWHEAGSSGRLKRAVAECRALFHAASLRVSIVDIDDDGLRRAQHYAAKARRRALAALLPRLHYALAAITLTQHFIYSIEKRHFVIIISHAAR